MKSKSFYLKILFLFLTAATIVSCEPNDINEQLTEQNVKENTWDIQAIDRGEVEDPGDRGDKD